MWQVGRYLGFTGCDAGILREAALDCTRHDANTTALDPELALAARAPQSSAERALRQLLRTAVGSARPSSIDA